LTEHSIYYERGVTKLGFNGFLSPSPTVRNALSGIIESKYPRFSLPERNMALRVRVSSQEDLGFSDPIDYKVLLHGSSGGRYLLAHSWIVFFLPQIVRERRNLLDLKGKEEFFRLLTLPFDDGYGKKVFTVQSTPYGCILTLSKIQERPWKLDRLWLTVVPE
jgi:hypothetical protein